MAGTFVYIFEAEAVAAAMSDWPEQMQVAVCLTPDGGCELVVHHADELGRILQRIAAMQGEEGMAVAPDVAGYATRKVLFSEEQQLLSLVADSPDLAELACDYAINYRFARDQGLDPDPTLNMAGPEIGPEVAPETGPEIAQEVAPAMEPATGAAALTERSRMFLTHLSLPSGYAAHSVAQKPECFFLTGRLERVGDDMRLHIAPEATQDGAPPVRATRIGFRDDYARFVLPRSDLDGWTVGQAVRLDMRLDLFPDAVIARYLQVSDACQVTITARGVFVSPASLCNLAPLQAPVAASAVAKPKRRLLRTVHMAVGGLVAIMVVTGHFAAALDRSPAADAGLSVADQQNFPATGALSAKIADANSALGLLASMNR